MSTADITLGAGGGGEHAHAGHHHGHSDDPYLKHYFANREQQGDTAKLGMWLFLATEILLFGGLFVGFGMMQARHAEAFKAAHHHLDWRLGFLNTVVLLVSSYTMVMAVDASTKSQKKKLVVNLAITLACAATFMVVKYFEYSHKYHDGLLPGRFFTYEGGKDYGQMVFFSFYFMMTGLHGFHILGGMALLTWLLVKSRQGAFHAQYNTPVDLIGLYWHLVDLIWIYLFPLLYLIT